MPKGVEHTLARVVIAASRTVLQPSLMPKGVEHFATPMARSSMLAPATLTDAERR